MGIKLCDEPTHKIREFFSHETKKGYPRVMIAFKSFKKDEFHLPNIDLVINYDIPTKMDSGERVPDYAEYLERTNHGCKFCEHKYALNLYRSLNPEDDLLLTKIEKACKIKMKKMKPSLQAYMKNIGELSSSSDDDY